ncbi:MAG: hypothetical protein U0165_05110 [Polyangiaceae bacterium]
MKRDVGIEEPIKMIDLLVEVGEVQRVVSCGVDGSTFITLEEGTPAGRKHVRVVKNAGKAEGVELMAEGDVDISSATWQKGRQTLPTAVQVGSAGQRVLTGNIDGGALVMNQWTPIWLRPPAGAPEVNGLTLTAEGADVRPPEKSESGWLAMVRAGFVSSTLSLKDSEGNSWEIRAPVRTAPFAVVMLDPQRSKAWGERRAGFVNFNVESSSGRKRAYARVENENGIHDALMAELEKSDTANPTTSASMMISVPAGPSWLVVSAEPGAAGSSAVSIPIGGATPATDGRMTQDARWLDGVSMKSQLERERLSWVTRSVVVFVALAALLEALILIERANESRRKLAAHVALMNENAPRDEITSLEERRNSLRVAIMLVGVLVVFSMLAMAMIARI